MTPRKKKTYIIIISVCLLATAAILLWGYGNPFSKSQSVSQLPAGTGAPAVAPTQNSGNAAATFPANRQFDTSIFDSSLFKSFEPYDFVKLDPSEIGRDDPFKDY